MDYAPTSRGIKGVIVDNFKPILPCSRHEKRYCDSDVCRAEKSARDYISGADPGDDSEFLDKHKKQWPKYQPQWKNKGMVLKTYIS